MIVVSGDRPTGQLHLGHLVGSLNKRLELQHQATEMFILVADNQVANNRVSALEEVAHNSLALVATQMAMGITADNVHYVLSSCLGPVQEMAAHFSNYCSLAEIQRNPTIKAEAVLYNRDSASLGFLNYPISQCADVAAFTPCCVPVGEDQGSVLEFARDLVARFNTKTNSEVFAEISPLYSPVPRLLGMDGVNKMSKSLNNAIFLSESTESLKKKVFSLYTDPKHIKISDPGQLDGNMVFYYLDVFMRDRQELQRMKEHYSAGGLGDTAVKGVLFSELEFIISPIRSQVAEITDEMALERLRLGTKRACQVAALKLEEMRRAMGFLKL